jgi:hypothetical protein
MGSESPQPELQKLLLRHHQIIDLALQGLTQREISAAVGLHETAISRILNSPLVQGEIARRRVTHVELLDTESIKNSVESNALATLREAAPRAAQCQVDLMNSDDPRTALAASKEILNRALGSGNENVTVNITVEQMTVLEKALKESRHVTITEIKALPVDIPVGVPANA